MIDSGELADPPTPKEGPPMPPHTVTCPHCQALLRSDRPMPAGASLRCPGCKASFSAPAYRSAQASSPIGLRILIGAVVAVVLGGAIVVAVVLLNRKQTSPNQDDSARFQGESQDLADARKELDRKARKLDYDQAMRRGEAAMEKKLFADAEKAYDDALKQIPGDVKAEEGRLAARAALLAMNKPPETDNNTERNIALLLAEGEKASAQKQYALAVRLLIAAKLIAPTNTQVLTALEAGRDGACCRHRREEETRRFPDATGEGQGGAHHEDLPGCPQ